VTKRWGLLRYTLLRVAMFLVIWAILQYLTPIKGLLALALAILISGSISFFVLDRVRDDASGTLFGFFRGINERIDASTRAEDEADDAARSVNSVNSEDADKPASAGEGETQAQQ